MVQNDPARKDNQERFRLVGNRFNVPAMYLRAKARRTAHRLRRDAHILWIAARDPRTPFAAKAVGALVATYVLSPIDLIPDFVPLFGLLDEMIIVPVGMLIAAWLIPRPLMADFRKQADEAVKRPVTRAGMIIILGLWTMIAVFLALHIWSLRYW